jgi:tetratricopeptide (TPR) repeat protein
MAIDWDLLRGIADRLSQPVHGGGHAVQEDLEEVSRALDILLARQDLQGILRLRNVFTAVIARDSISVHASLQRLSNEAIMAAKQLGDWREQAHLLGANGHNLHRQGLHQRAIKDFYDSFQLYEKTGETMDALKSYYMIALCQRALGNTADAKHILLTTISQIDPEDPWLSNPLCVLGWLKRDEGDLPGAETLLRKALKLHRQAPDSDPLIAGTLADLGEVLGQQGRTQEARACFYESLNWIRKHQGQFDRQEARTEMKLAELLIREKKYAEALALLNHADDLISYGAYKDQLWKIELLRAMIKIQQGNFRGALQRIRSAITIYRELGLPPKEFFRHIVNRLKLR